MLYDWDDYDYDDLATCTSVGMGGNCGEDCPVFLRGECDEEDNAIDTIVEMINNPKCDRTYESYDEPIQDMIDDRIYDEHTEKVKENDSDFNRAMEIFE